MVIFCLTIGFLNVPENEEPSADSGSTDRGQISHSITDMILSKTKSKNLQFHVPLPGATLARVLTEKRLSLVKAWEENEKVKAENK